jgi:O-antigen/teichoic acid export membrane protein
VSVQFARKSFLGALAAVSITLSSFLSGVIVARTLGLEGTGAVAYVVWLVLMLAPVLDLGMSPAIMRTVPDLRARGENDRASWLSGHLGRLLGVSVALGVIAVWMISGLPGLASHWHTAQPVAGKASPDVLRYVLPLFVAAQALGAYAYAYLRGAQAFDQVAKVAGVSLVIQLACVAVGSLWFGVAGAVAGFAAGQLLPAIMACRLMRTSGTPDSDLRRRVFRYALFAWAGNVANTFVWSRIEVFFLERSSGYEAVGQFTVALALTSIAVQGPQLLTTGFLPLFSAKLGQRDMDATRTAFAAGTRLLAALAFPACFGMAAVMPVLLPLIYGPAFGGATPAAIILVMAAAVSVTSVVATNLIHANERSDFVFYTATTGAVLSILSGFLFIPVFGLIGAAASRAAIQCLLVGIGCWFVVRRLHYPLPFGSLGLLALAALACWAAAALCIATIPGPLSLLAAIPAGAVAYIVALRLLRALPPSDLTLLDKVASALPRPMSKIARALLKFLAPPPDAAGPRLPQETGA